MGKTFCKSMAKVLIFMMVVSAFTITGLSADQSEYEPALEAHYTLDEVNGRYAIDSSGNGRHSLAMSATPKADEGYIGGALELDGAGDYIQLSDNVGSSGFMHDSFTERTISLRFKINDTASKQVLFEQGGSTAGLAIRIDQNQLEAAVASGNTRSVLSTPFSETSQWHHVVVTFNAGELSLYLDGTLQGTITAPFTTVAAQGNGGGAGARFEWDAFNDGTSAAISGHFAGLLDDLRIYNVDISDDPYEIPGPGPSPSYDEIIYVSNYGAVGDGITDDGPAIQAAIEAALQLSGSKKVVFGSALNYRIAEKTSSWEYFHIEDANQLTIEGNGATLVFEPGNNAFVFKQAEGLVVRNLNIDYSPLTQTQGSVSAVAPVDGALDFNGTSHFVKLAGTAASGFLHDAFTSRTVSMWVKPDESAAKQVLFDEGGSGNGLAIRLHNGSLEAAIVDNNRRTILSTPYAPKEQSDPTVIVDETKWLNSYHKVTLYFDNGTFKLYLDEELRGSTTTPFSSVRAHSNGGALGARVESDAFGDGAVGSTSGFYQGLMNEVRVYSDLSTLLAYYKLDETSGTVAQDSSGNGRHSVQLLGTWAVNGGQGSTMAFDFQIESGYPSPPSDEWVRIHHNNWDKGIFFDETVYNRLEGTSLEFAKMLSVENVASGVYRVTLLPKYTNKGSDHTQFINEISLHDRFALAISWRTLTASSAAAKTGLKAATIHITESEDVLFENVNIYATMYMGIRAFENTGPVTFRGINIMRKPGTTRLLATNSDGIHNKRNEIGAIIENSYIESVFDDSINNSTIGDKVIEIYNNHDFLLQNNDGLYNETIRTGDQLQFIDYALGRTLGSGTVTSVTTVNGNRRVVLDTDIPGVIAMTAGNPADENTTRVYDLTRVGDGFTVRNNVLRPVFRQAALIRGYNAVVEGNRVDSLGGLGFSFTDDIQFNAGPAPQQAVVRNNTILNSVKWSILFASSWKTPTVQMLYDEGAGIGNGGLGLRLKNGKLEAGVHNGSGLTSVQTELTDKDVWHEAKLVFNQGLLQLYLDGVLRASDTAPFSTVPAHGNGGALGARESKDIWNGGGNSGLSGFFDGLIDEVMIYTDIAESNLLAWYKLDAASGTTAADSANGHNSVAMSGTWRPADGAVNGTLDLNGRSDYIKLANSGISSGFMHDGFSTRVIKLFFKARAPFRERSASGIHIENNRIITNKNPGQHAIFVKNAENISLLNNLIDLRGASYSGNSVPLYLENAKNVSVDHLTIMDNRPALKAGIYAIGESETATFDFTNLSFSLHPGVPEFLAEP